MDPVFHGRQVPDKGPLHREDTTGDSLVLVFEDEPLERILYGEELGGPTTANLFYPALEHMRKIKRAHTEGNGERILEEACDLGRSGREISAGMCMELALILGRVVPNYSNPVLPFDISGLHPLVDQMWNLAIRNQDKSLQKGVGTLAYRWYEHQAFYENAREVLAKLIEIFREDRNRLNEAVMLNNFGFEYFLESRYREAISYFEEAAEIFKTIGDLFDYANSRSNYWICRFEGEDLDDLDRIEAEIRDYEKVLHGKGGWQERKPLLLFAKIEERKGNIEKAITLVKQAIESSLGSKTRYPELDKRYLERLESTR